MNSEQRQLNREYRIEREFLDIYSIAIKTLFCDFCCSRSKYLFVEDAILRIEPFGGQTMLRVPQF